MKFFIKSLGCKQNQLEGAIIQDELIKAGFKQVQDEFEADIYILNSCTVTAHSDSEANYLINRVKKNNPKIKTILTGCCAQTYKNKNININADLILGNSEKLDIVKYIKNQGFFVEDIFKQKEFKNKTIQNVNCNVQCQVLYPNLVNLLLQQDF